MVSMDSVQVQASSHKRIDDKDNDDRQRNVEMRHLIPRKGSVAFIAG